MATVKVYSTPTCPWCKKAKDFLSEHKIAFQDMNVAEDMVARQDMMKRSGQMGVPVVDIDGELVIGYDIPKLKTKLGVA